MKRPKKRNRPQITSDRFCSRDYYRAQVNLNDKMWWAVPYNMIADTDPDFAEKFRNKFSKDIQDYISDHAKSLMKSRSFKVMLEQWIEENVGPDFKGQVRMWLRKNLPQCNPSSTTETQEQSYQLFKKD